MEQEKEEDSINLMGGLTTLLGDSSSAMNTMSALAIVDASTSASVIQARSAMSASQMSAGVRESSANPATRNFVMPPSQLQEKQSIRRPSTFRYEQRMGVVPANGTIRLQVKAI